MVSVSSTPGTSTVPRAAHSGGTARPGKARAATASPA